MRNLVRLHKQLITIWSPLLVISILFSVQKRKLYLRDPKCIIPRQRLWYSRKVESSGKVQDPACCSSRVSHDISEDGNESLLSSNIPKDSLCNNFSNEEEIISLANEDNPCMSSDLDAISEDEQPYCSSDSSDEDCPSIDSQASSSSEDDNLSTNSSQANSSDESNNNSTELKQSTSTQRPANNEGMLITELNKMYVTAKQPSVPM